ncbi:hypothetical protein [Spirosoma luteum]|uniref:hypothetical protein n=1 Tax=Spirosoma luteum TaxID=431553 RepID=UPI00036F5EF7|nr:hypothetical protein [Spirosoma luteum]
MGRELRKVPADWEHPKQHNGNYQPMYEEYYGDAIADWINEHQQWENGTHPTLVVHPEYKEEYPFYAMWNGGPPNVDYYRTRKFTPEELTHIQLYETTSEGTPKTPVFPADQLEQLCEYAAEHCTTFGSFKATKQEWFDMLSRGFVSHTEGNAIFI